MPANRIKFMTAIIRLVTFCNRARFLEDNTRITTENIGVIITVTLITTNNR